MSDQEEYQEEVQETTAPEAEEDVAPGDQNEGQDDAQDEAPEPEPEPEAEAEPEAEQEPEAEPEQEPEPEEEQEPEPEPEQEQEPEPEQEQDAGVGTHDMSVNAVEIPAAEVSAADEAATASDEDRHMPVQFSGGNNQSQMTKAVTKQPVNETRDVSGSLGQNRSSYTRADILREHAALCTHRSEQNRNHEMHRQNAMRAIASLARAGQPDAGDLSETFQLMVEEDANLFSEIPDDLRRKGPRRAESNRRDVERYNEFHNDTYQSPKRLKASGPRAIVDISRPLPIKNHPNPLAVRTHKGTGRYEGLSKGDFTALERDPVYHPDPEHNPRLKIKHERDAFIASMMKPLSQAAYEAKFGIVQPKRPKVVSKFFVPRCGVEMPEGHGEEAKQKRAYWERMNMTSFKP